MTKIKWKNVQLELIIIDFQNIIKLEIKLVCLNTNFTGHNIEEGSIFLGNKRREIDEREKEAVGK